MLVFTWMLKGLVLFVKFIVQTLSSLMLLFYFQAAETLPAYPNICFAVDDFDDTFDAVVT